MRGWVSAVANYSEPVALGAVMRSLPSGASRQSRHPDFHPGEYVTGMFGWQDYAVVDAEAIQRKVDGSGLPISTSLGVLGLNGLTAYFALLDVGQPKAGETVVVSTAAGAVGSCVGSNRQDQGLPHRRHCRRARTRCACAARSSATTLPSTTRPTISSRHSTPRARRASTSTSTTRPADQRRRHAPSQRRRARGHLRHGVRRELGPATAGTAGRAPSSRQARAHAGLSHLRLCATLSRGAAGAREAGCATDRSAIGRTFSTESSRRRARSPGLYRGENLGKRLIRIAPDVPD